MRKAIHILLLFLVLTLPMRAQDADRVRLVSAKSAQIIDENGESYRKVVGPARFFHNNTWLICDTALWNVNTNIIDAVGHVRIIQDRTKLTSATLQYVVDENMAKFRGDLVQLEDDDKNTLRTRYLDYNTKDSVAIFQGGAAMRDKDGQVIESQYGTYDSKARLFVFNENVNMYLDTTFVKTSRLEYRTDLATAWFGYGTDMWQDDKMLSANDGRYERDNELFFFRRKVHILTEDQEAWADSLYYQRAFNNVEMLGNVELMDTTRNVFALAGRFEYTDSLSQIVMTRDPAIMSVTEEKGVKDSLYVGADILRYRAIPRCDIPDGTVKSSEQRLKDLSGDPVSEYRKKAAEAAAKAAEEAAKNDPNRPPERPAPKKPSALPAPTDTLSAPIDTLSAPADSLAAPVDSLAVRADSLAPPADTLAVPAEPPKDTTKVNFIWGSGNVKMFRKDMQMASDSLAYTDLDSLIRMYRDPVFYNEGNRQYAADSIMMVIRNKRAEKAHLLSNAFITIQEDTLSYDQIRGAEMVAYFDSTSALTRFDALGGAASIFFLVENDALATVNKVESKMIYATFKEGNIERMYYYDNPKNDGYPTVQLPKDEKQLKGFRWEPEKRPASPLDVTALKTRPSERIAYLAHPHASFNHTDTYFPGHIKKVYRDIAIRDSLKVARSMQEQAAMDTVQTITPADTLSAPAPPADSLSSEKPPVPEAAPAETATDSLSVTTPVSDDPKALKKAERERKKAEKRAAREAKWAEEDRIYEEKQAEKAQKKLEKQRARKLKALRRLEKKAQKEYKLLQKYIRKEQAKTKKP